MLRLYLDSNVIQYMKHGKSRSHRLLKELLDSHTDSYISFFSPAHISDFKADVKSNQLKDLIFMENYVQENFISYSDQEGIANFLIATPIEVHKAESSNEGIAKGLEQALDFLQNLDSNKENWPEDEPDLLKSLNDLKLPIFPQAVVKNQPAEVRQFIEDFYPVGKTEVSVSELATHFVKGMVKLFDNPKSWQGVRRHSMTQAQNQKFDVFADITGFNENLKKSTLSQSFFDFVNHLLESRNIPQNNTYEYFQGAFLAMNLLGLDREKNNKVKLPNTVNDGLHCYYAGHCDILISNDKGLKIKATALYKHFGIETVVYDIDEFLEIGHLLLSSGRISAKEFFGKLQFDVKHGLITETKPSFRYPRNYLRIQSPIVYFGFFNEMQVIQDQKEGNFILLTHAKKFFSGVISFKEFQAVVNSTMNTFGPDLELLGSFTPIDSTMISSNSWTGRRWIVGQLPITLEVNPGTQRFCLSIGPF